MVGTVPAVEFYKLENVRFLSFLYLMTMEYWDKKLSLFSAL